MYTYLASRFTFVLRKNKHEPVNRTYLKKNIRTHKTTFQKIINKYKKYKFNRHLTTETIKRTRSPRKFRGNKRAQGLPNYPTWRRIYGSQIVYLYCRPGDKRVNRELRVALSQHLRNARALTKTSLIPIRRTAKINFANQNNTLVC